MRTCAIGMAMLAGASAANAALISFASDSSPTNPTLVGTYNAGTQTTTITDFGPTPVTLLVDPDESGPLPATPFAANLLATFTLGTYAGATQIIPGFFSHTFNLSGSFEFRDPGTNDLLIAGSVGGGSAAFVGLGGLQNLFSASIAGFDIAYNAGPAVAALTGIAAGTGDFGYTFTSINTGAGTTLVPSGNTIVGVNNFTAESSFSGRYVPTPGAAALMALAGVLVARRRR